MPLGRFVSFSIESETPSHACGRGGISAGERQPRAGGLETSSGGSVRGWPGITTVESGAGRISPGSASGGSLVDRKRFWAEAMVQQARVRITAHRDFFIMP